jgi:hypothetical protein
MIPGEAQVAKQRHKGIAIRAGAIVVHGGAGREEEYGVRGGSKSSRSRQGRRERGELTGVLKVARAVAAPGIPASRDEVVRRETAKATPLQIAEGGAV